MTEAFENSESKKVENASEAFRANMSASDIADLRELRTYLSQNGDWSDASDEKVLDDFFWENAHSYIIRGDLGTTPEESKRIVATGQLDLSTGNKTGTVEHIVAHPAMRGYGLGKKIMEHLIAEANTFGLEKLVLTSNPTREAAHGLYKSLGFKIIGEKQKYDSGGNPSHMTCIFELDLKA